MEILIHVTAAITQIPVNLNMSNNLLNSATTYLKKKIMTFFLHLFLTPCPHKIWGRGGRDKIYAVQFSVSNIKI